MFQARDIHTVTSTSTAQLVGTIALSVAAGVDVLIAICMTFLLVREWKVTRITGRRQAHPPWNRVRS